MVLCPVCGKEGKKITVLAGNKARVVFYHPEKIGRHICNIANGEESREEEL